MSVAEHGKRFGSPGPRGADDCRRPSGLTLIELLVVLSIVSFLMAILLPALGKVRQQARRVISAGNLRQIVTAADAFSCDNADRYPPSVARIGFGENWTWQEPTVLTGFTKRSPAEHRSVSAYLHHYLPDADVLFCPNAPLKYRFLQEAWDGGDAWDCPDITPQPDAMLGVYCLLWNYDGYLGEEEGLFRGPSGPARAHRESRILVTEYLGYDHWRSEQSFGSCERFRGAQIAEGSPVSSAFWTRPGAGTPDELASLDIKLHAGYVDGHVESYLPADTASMSLILNPATGAPYSDGPGPCGFFYLPRPGIH